MYYLYPSPPFNFLVDLFLSPSVSLLSPICHPSTEMHSYFSTQFSSFYSGIGSPVHLDRRPLPTASTTRPVISILPTLTCSPGPSRPLHPRATRLFFRLFPSLLAPLSPPLTSLVSLTTPVSATFYLLPSSASSLNHPPPFWPRTAALSLPVLRRFVSPVPGLLSPSLCFILTRSFASPFLGVLWWFVFFRVTF